MADVDGDGGGDVLVGAYNEDGGRDRSGRAYVFNGATGALLHTLTSPRPSGHGHFGTAVAEVPDVDDDGRPDLLIGATGEDDREYNTGRAYLFSGATGGLLRTLLTPAPQRYGYFGAPVSGVADLDGDGRGDLIVGASSENRQAGRVYAFSGATGALLRTITSPEPDPPGQYGFFGASLADVGNVDGDGRSDLLIGASAENGGAEDSGRAYVLSGSSGALLHTLTSPKPEESGYFGQATSGVADVDGDGRGDLLVAAPYEFGGDVGSGVVYVFSGGTGALLGAVLSPNAERNAFFGYAVAGSDDADGDGRGDVIVGAVSEDGGLLDSGRAYLSSVDVAGQLTVTASGEPDTVPAGGAVAVTAVASNTSTQSVTADLWLVIDRDGTPVQTRLIGRSTLPGGTTGTATTVADIAETTAPGTYTFTVNIGTFPDVTVASDAFPVTVTGAPPPDAPR